MISEFTPVKIQITFKAALKITQDYVLGISAKFLLIMTIVVLNLFYCSTKSLLFGMKCVSAHQDF